MLYLFIAWRLKLCSFAICYVLFDGLNERVYLGLKKILTFFFLSSFLLCLFASSQSLKLKTSHNTWKTHFRSLQNHSMFVSKFYFPDIFLTKWSKIHNFVSKVHLCWKLFTLDQMSYSKLKFLTQSRLQVPCLTHKLHIFLCKIKPTSPNPPKTHKPQTAPS